MHGSPALTEVLSDFQLHRSAGGQWTVEQTTTDLTTVTATVATMFVIDSTRLQLALTECRERRVDGTERTIACHDLMIDRDAYTIIRSDNGYAFEAYADAQVNPTLITLTHTARPARVPRESYGASFVRRPAMAIPTPA